MSGILPVGFLPPSLPKLSRVLVWLRRDLRLEDNPALAVALNAAVEVVCQRFPFSLLKFSAFQVERKKASENESSSLEATWRDVGN